MGYHSPSHINKNGQASPYYFVIAKLLSGIGTHPTQAKWDAFPRLGQIGRSYVEFLGMTVDCIGEYNTSFYLYEGKTLKVRLD
jgi:hypothetical protein